MLSCFLRVACFVNVCTGGRINFFLDHSLPILPEVARVVASGSDDKIVRVWKTSTWQNMFLLEEHESGVNAIAFSSDSNLLASVSGFGISERNSIKIWDMSTGQVMQQFELYESDIVLTAKGRIFLTGKASQRIDQALVSLSSNKLQQSFFTIEKDWVQWQRHDLFWLPHEYRNGIIAKYDNILAIGQQSGRVSFLKIAVPSRSS